MLGDDADLPAMTYARLRGLDLPRRRKRRRLADIDDADLPFAPGRDPKGLGTVLDGLSRQSGWETRLAEEDIIRQWSVVAGEQTAQHATPVDLHDGVLTVRCDSTAWTRQLTLLRAEILTTINREYPEARVRQLRFLGPDVPTWKRGRRTVPGRGPRDTYG